MLAVFHLQCSQEDLIGSGTLLKSGYLSQDELEVGDYEYLFFTPHRYLDNLGARPIGSTKRNSTEYI
jgi:hypothetical protein